MNGRIAVFKCVNVHSGSAQVDLIPGQIRGFTDPESVLVGHEQQKCIPGTVPTEVFGSVNEVFDLGTVKYSRDRFSRLATLTGGPIFFFYFDFTENDVLAVFFATSKNPEGGVLRHLLYRKGTFSGIFICANKQSLSGTSPASSESPIDDSLGTERLEWFI